MRAERVPGVRQVPGALTRPQGDVVLFSSWRGAFNDNPRAISEALHARRPELRQVWAAEDGVASSLPPWAAQVPPGSRAHLRSMGAAGHVVSNVEMPGYFRKRRHTRYLQTWHGTPLKRIAFDLPADFPEHRAYLDRLRRDVAQWDALVSPNPFSTEVLRGAFRFGGEILETGYPRNDVLRAPGAEQRRAAVRQALALDDGVRAVLYAPTWRDRRSFDLHLDIAALGRRLGDGHRLLLRTHPLAPAVLGPDERAWATDVSGHPDIRELYLAADVLITDYSSTMFDFAVTGRPMLFFTYDLAAYRDQLRGFYFDFVTDAPGPLLADTAAVGDALEDLDAVVAAHVGDYARFRERFCPWDDGAAADRVVQAFFR